MDAGEKYIFFYIKIFLLGKSVDRYIYCFKSIRFKYPLTVIHSMLESETRQVPISIMYDLACKLEPYVKVCMKHVRALIN